MHLHRLIILLIELKNKLFHVRDSHVEFFDIAFIGWLWVAHNILGLLPYMTVDRFRSSQKQPFRLPLLPESEVGKLPTLLTTEAVSALPPPPK